MKKKISIIILLVGLAALQCSKFDSNKPDLKKSLMNSVDNVNTAIGKISVSKGYEMLTVNGGTGATGVLTGTGADAKSVEFSDLADSVTLDMVSGIYDFKPDASHHWHYFFPISLFKKTGTSNHMIVNMPQRMMFRPKYLFNFGMNDSIPKNNFTIDASAYHSIHKGWYSSDYNLVASFTYEKADIGNCKINSHTNPGKETDFTSVFNFPEGYNITVEQTAIDTARSSSFALKDDKDILLKETSVITKTGNHMFEKQYIISIGNVEIKRSSAVDSIQVYLDGVLQQKAAVKIVDPTADKDEDKSICHSRDLQITFDDGTTTNLSVLINPARETLKTLVSSLGDMYFARHIVDYIAMSIAVSAH
jgi:hypothetical protein